MLSTTLVTVVNGPAYERMSDELFESAVKHFHPTPIVHFLMLQGKPGWPDATMYRHHALARHMPNSSFVFLSDADMRFESRVGPEILNQEGITATQHPGYVGKPSNELPYERRHESCCFIYIGGQHYYAGGFVGGPRQKMLNLSNRIAGKIDTDAGNRVTPVWHDESALNRTLVDIPPRTILSPSYCYPDDSSYYRANVWHDDYVRKLVALDKTSDQRGDR